MTVSSKKIMAAGVVCASSDAYQMQGRYRNNTIQINPQAQEIELDNLEVTKEERLQRKIKNIDQDLKNQMNNIDQELNNLLEKNLSLEGTQMAYNLILDRTKKLMQMPDFSSSSKKSKIVSAREAWKKQLAEQQERALKIYLKEMWKKIKTGNYHSHMNAFKYLESEKKKLLAISYCNKDLGRYYIPNRIGDMWMKEISLLGDKIDEELKNLPAEIDDLLSITFDENGQIDTKRFKEGQEAALKILAALREDLEERYGEPLADVIKRRISPLMEKVKAKKACRTRNRRAINITLVENLANNQKQQE